MKKTNEMKNTRRIEHAVNLPISIRRIYKFVITLLT